MIPFLNLMEIRIFLRILDPTFAHLSKPINCKKHTTGFEDVALVQGQGQQTSNCNKIIVEIICHNSIDSKKFPKPAAACGNYHSSEITTPKYGQHLRVSGSYVFDHDLITIGQKFIQFLN